MPVLIRAKTYLALTINSSNTQNSPTTYIYYYLLFIDEECGKGSMKGLAQAQITSQCESWDSNPVGKLQGLVSVLSCCVTEQNGRSKAMEINVLCPGEQRGQPARHGRCI